MEAKSKPWLPFILKTVIVAASILIIEIIFYFGLNISDVIEEWFFSIVGVVISVILGLPGLAGCVLGSLTSLAVVGYSFSELIIFTFSKDILFVIAYFAGKKIKNLNTTKEFVFLSAFSVLGCFVSFVFQYYFSDIYGILDNNLMFTVMNYLTSNIICVLCIAIPICALILYIMHGKDNTVPDSEKYFTRNIFIIMPVSITVFLLSFYSMKIGEYWTTVDWFQAYLSTAGFIFLLIIILLLLKKWKKQTLIGIAICLLAVFIVGLCHKNPLISLIVVAVAFMYCLFRIIFYKKIEDTTNVKKWIKTICSIFNILFITLSIFMAVIVDTIIVLPLSDYTEKYVIVLGAPVYEGEPSDILEDRIQMAEDYCSQNPNALYFLTGGVKKGSGNLSEANAIGNRLIEVGLSKKQIVFECDAKTTLENFQNIHKIFEEKGYNKNDRVAIISSIFHYPRASLYAHQAGFTNISFVQTPYAFISNFLWCLREAIVFPGYFFT